MADQYHPEQGLAMGLSKFTEDQISASQTIAEMRKHQVERKAVSYIENNIAQVQENNDRLMALAHRMEHRLDIILGMDDAPRTPDHVEESDEGSLGKLNQMLFLLEQISDYLEVQLTRLERL